MFSIAAVDICMCPQEQRGTEGAVLGGGGADVRDITEETLYPHTPVARQI